MTAPGTRVVAIRDSKDGTVNIYGYGVYAGDFPRPGSGQWSDEQWQLVRDAIVKMDGRAESFDQAIIDWQVSEGQLTAEEGAAKLAELAQRRSAEQARPLDERARATLERMDLNPRIDLDNGTSVWGFMCWWGPIDAFEKRYAGMNVVTVEFGELEHRALGN